MRLLACAFAYLTIASGALADAVTVESCGRQIEFEQPPQRAVSNDSNMTEMMLALELEASMVGYTGVSGLRKMGEFTERVANLPELSRDYPTKEVLVAADADFYFAGWNYGLKVGGEVTPEALEPFGITVYELTESCIHVGPKSKASMEDLYADLLNLGTIFDIRARAETLVASYREELAAFKAGLSELKSPVRVFIYDSGIDAPFTAGKYAMPTALIEYAGGKNVFDDLEKSWATVNWEALVERAPDFIVIVDYGEVTAEQKIEFMRDNSALEDIPAVKNNRFFVLGYAEATPGPRNIEAAKRLATAFRER